MITTMSCKYLCPYKATTIFLFDQTTQHMNTSSPIRDQTCAPRSASTVLTTGLPGKSLLQFFYYIPCTLYYTPMTYLFYNWRSVSLNPLHLFGPALQPPSLWQLHICVCCHFALFCFLDSRSDYTDFSLYSVYLCLTHDAL